MIFFDSHCHLDLVSEKLDLTQVLSNCKKNQVKGILMPATTRSSWDQLAKIKQSHSTCECRLAYALGLHPYFIEQVNLDFDLSELESRLKQDLNLVAVGEIGLDNFVAKKLDNMALQEKLFTEQLKLAQAFKLPVIIHHRQSIDKICQLLRRCKFEYGGVVHAFSGSLQQAQVLIELGFKLGLGGTITYPRANKTLSAIKALEPVNFLLETDAPDMPINGRQGQANSPEYLPEIFTELAKLVDLPQQRLSEVLWQNTMQAFPRLLG